MPLATPPPTRWTVDPAGIDWRVERSAPPHVDHIETYEVAVHGRKAKRYPLGEPIEIVVD